MVPLKVLEKQKWPSPKLIERIKIRAEINEMETKKSNTINETIGS
jgi:hypothetical protein